MLNKFVPFYTTLIFMACSCVLGVLLLRQIQSNNELKEMYEQAHSSGGACSYKLTRLGGYKYTRPLMYAEPVCESLSMQGIKAQLEQLIGDYRAQGLINNASIYLREFKNGEWISIGDDQKHSPGSLLKIPELIAFYKMNEKNPGYLDTKVKYDAAIPTTKKTHFLSKSIEVGKTYTIRELLKYMVEYSDNNATNLLNKIIDIPTFKKVFTDLGLPEPDWSASDYPLTAREYSTFLKVLYNAAYLDIRDSDACLELMRNSEFREGIRAAVPESAEVLSKFGEGGADASPDLSESSLVATESGTFLLTVMVNGKDIQQLPKIIRDISGMAYRQFNGLRTGTM